MAYEYNFKNKKILITQPLLLNFLGSTMVTLELADFFISQGAKVTIYTVCYGSTIQQICEDHNLKIITFDDGEKLSMYDYDFIWVHSQILPIGIVNELNKKIHKKHPAFIFLHMSGAIDSCDEWPWIYSLEESLSSKSLFISNHSKKLGDKFLPQSINKGFFRNPASKSFMQRTQPVHCTLKNILVVSNHPPAEILALKHKLKSHNINVEYMGQGKDCYEPFSLSILSRYDAIITIGKTVQYCLLSSTPVYVYDHFGGPGWLKGHNYKKTKYYAFSGKGFSKKTVDEIESELISGFSGALKYLQAEQKNFSKDYCIDKVVPKIFQTIEPKTIKRFSPKFYLSVLVSQYVAHRSFAIFQEREVNIEKTNKILDLGQKLHDKEEYIKYLESYQSLKIERLIRRCLKPFIRLIKK